IDWFYRTIRSLRLRHVSRSSSADAWIRHISHRRSRAGIKRDIFADWGRARSRRCVIWRRECTGRSPALAVMLAIRSALNDEPNLLIAVADGLPDSRVRDRLVELSRLKETPSDVAAKFGSSGYVVESVPLALYCAQAICVETLPNVLSAAIRAGGDTDTIASMAGPGSGTKGC